MATQKIHSNLVWNNTETKGQSITAKYLAFVDGQEPNALFYWLGSLLIHGCILVPLTFLLVYSLGGPTMPFLFISMVCFFINIIANMGGASFRFSFNTFVFSIAIHALIVVSTLLLTL